MRNAELHAAVLAAPDDDGPRQVYADWLMQRGDPRGELIALQIARSKRDDPSMAAREQDLWSTYEVEWNARYIGADVTYRNGFVECVRCTPALFRQPGALDDACVRAIEVNCDPKAEEVPLAVVLGTLAKLPLRSLVLRYAKLSLDDTRAIASLAGLERLALIWTLHRERLDLAHARILGPR